MNVSNKLSICALCCAFVALPACSSTSSSSSSLPSTSNVAQVRFVDGAPALETLVNGYPTDIGLAYLQVGGSTVTYNFVYGAASSFAPEPAGVQSLVARDTLGYAVGPLKSASLSPGGRYTLVVVGTYPNYNVLTFSEPKNASGARLSLYEASPEMPSADFGSFDATTGSGFKKLGSARLGTVATVSLGGSVTNLGGYVGTGTTPVTHGTLAPVQVNAFDTSNALPFNASSRFSLFLFDVKPGTASGPVFGSLDR